MSASRNWWPVFHTVKRLMVEGQWRQLWYPLQWRALGYDFGSVPIESLGINPERGHAHGNSGGPDLERVLREIGIPAGSRVLDLGCGKGGALLTMAKFPFAEIVGLDVSRDLLCIAKNNCRRAAATRVDLVEGDGALFVDLDRFTHIYMYHPFPCSIVKTVCANLRASLARRERHLTLIYKNPACDDAVLSQDIFRVERDLKFGRTAPESERFRIYVHETPEQKCGGF